MAQNLLLSGIKETKMNRKKKQTVKKTFLLMMGVSLSLAFLYSGAEAATADNNLYQPLSFSSIVNPHSLINIDGIAFMCGTSPNSTTDQKTDSTTVTKDTKIKSGKKTLKDQKNSTSRRSANIDD